MAQNRGNNNRNKGKGGKGGKTDPTAYFTTTLTNKQATKQAKRVARIATRPQKREIKAEKRASNMRVGEIKDWFKGAYEPALEKSAAEAAAASTTAQSQIGTTANATSDYAEQLRQRLRQEGEADAALRGATYNPSTDTTDVQGQLARRAASDILSGVVATQGASTAAHYADKKRTGVRERIEQMKRERDRGRSFDADLRSLARETGDIRRDEYSRIRDAERDYSLGQAAANLDRKSLKTEAKEARRAQRETQRHNLASEATSAQNAATSARNANTSRMNARTSRGNLKQRKREERYERRHPDEAEKESKRDPQDVSRAGAIIRANLKALAKMSTQEIIDAIMLEDQTISRKEALKAYQRNVAAIQRAAAGA